MNEPSDTTCPPLTCAVCGTPLDPDVDVVVMLNRLPSEQRQDFIKRSPDLFARKCNQCNPGFRAREAEEKLKARSPLTLRFWAAFMVCAAFLTVLFSGFFGLLAWWWNDDVSWNTILIRAAAVSALPSWYITRNA